MAGVYFGKTSEEDDGRDAMLGEWMAEKMDSPHASFSEYVWHNRRAKVREEYPTLDPNGNFMRKGTCDHCGAWFQWGAVYQHKDGQHIVVGNVCAEKTMDVPSRHTLETNRLKSRMAAYAAAERKKAGAIKAAEVGGYSWLYAGPHAHKTLDDIAAKGLQYGGLTFAQEQLVKKIHDGTPTDYEVKRQERIAQRAAEDAAATPVPVTEDRITITGKILTTREEDARFGYHTTTVTKMLVRSEAGFKVWGTLPSQVDARRGDIITFSAKVQRSDKDETFGFFSRPTKARVVSRPVVNVSAGDAPQAAV